MADLHKEFEQPGAQYRGKPFWAWNGKLDPEELRRQVRVMHRMGLGGFFMHSRVGLDTAYLSDDWFECVDACIDEAKQLDMEAWLYDEDRWPSGAAGGLVTKNPKHRQRMLAMFVLDSAKDLSWSKDVLAVFTATVKGSEAHDVSRVAKGKKPKLAKGESILVFSERVAAVSSWYNDQAYLDTLSHEAVKEFIKVTHEEYEKRCGDDLGKTVPGIFTDEPNFGHKFRKNIFGEDEKEGVVVPWTPNLPKTFKKRYGYDILDHLPEVFFDVDGEPVAHARWAYHDCVTFLFVDAFARQIGEWCDRTNMQHTGHVLAEDTLVAQANVVGSCIRFYEYMQAPGMDLLTEHWRIYDTAKQVSSAARQFGRKWRLSETYGCTGWDFPFLGHKALGDWQVALGINLRCQHLTWYTMLGQAKRDYPASINYQSPWWEQYGKVEDYFGRVLSVMTKGEERRDILVVHPVESTWLQFKTGGPSGGGEGPDGKPLPTPEESADSMIGVREALLENHIDFDYGDEDVLDRHGKVSTSKGETVFRVGKATYRTVVVPSMTTMRSSTLKLLKRFQEKGGTVIFAGYVPSFVDVEPSDAARDFAKSCDRVKGAGKKFLSLVEPCREVSVADGDGKEIPNVLYYLREDRNAWYLFVCNTGHSPAQLRRSKLGRGTGDVFARERTKDEPDVRVTFLPDAKGDPEEWDAETGERFRADAKRTKDALSIRTSLPALGSRCFVIPKTKQRGSLPERPKLKQKSKRSLGGKNWDVVLTEANVAVFDAASFRIGGKGQWRTRTDILQIDSLAREALGLRPRGGQMVQPWAREETGRKKTVTVELVYPFEAKTVPSGDLFLGIEQPERFSIALNGADVSADAECGWWTDMSLRRVPLDPSLVRIGDNELSLSIEYDEDCGLEYVYLLGDFGVTLDDLAPVLVDPVETLRTGDWVKQGLPFYSGSVAYRRNVKVSKLGKNDRCILRLPDYRGVAARVLVGGREAGVVAWEPNETDVTDFIEDGRLDLRIEVLGHRRNSHGPFHLNEKWPAWTGPGQFYVAGEEYQLVPCGLMKDPELLVMK